MDAKGGEVVAAGVDGEGVGVHRGGGEAPHDRHNGRGALRRRFSDPINPSRAPYHGG